MRDSEKSILKLRNLELMVTQWESALRKNDIELALKTAMKGYEIASAYHSGPYRPLFLGHIMTAAGRLLGELTGQPTAANCVHLMLFASPGLFSVERPCARPV